MIDISKKIEFLKQQLEENKLDYLLIPMRDEFGCEYVPPESRRIEYISGFTGSNAYIIFGKENIEFFTDGRYTTQSKQQLDSKYFNIHNIAETKANDWIKNNIEAASNIGVYSKVVSVESFEELASLCEENKINLVSLDNDLIDKIWNNKPKPKHSKPFQINNHNYLSQIVNDLDTDYLFETDPENICYLLNLRGKDLAYTPIILCFALISKSGDLKIFSR